jgi:hypothetical protein
MEESNDARSDPGRGPRSNLPVPGQIAWSLLQRIIPKGFPYREELVGDLLEQWETEILPELGPKGARWWLWGQVLRNIPPMLRYRSDRAIGKCVVRVIHIGRIAVATDPPADRRWYRHPTPLGPVPANNRVDWDSVLARLDETERQIIELRLLGFTNAEIAERIGWSILKVQRFLKILRDSLSPT